MSTKDIIQPLVGTKDIVVKDLFFDAVVNAFAVAAQPTKKEQ